MKLVVIPEAHRQRVETVVRDVLGPAAGTEEIALTIVRTTPGTEWTVHASGLGDPVLEASYCGVIRDALRRADI